MQSACACPGAPEITVPVYACKEVRADIPNFVATNKSAQSAEACALEIGLSPSIPNWDGANPPDMMWGECPTPDYGELNFHEPAFIALYVFYGSCAAMLILWTLYKRMREKVGDSIFFLLVSHGPCLIFFFYTSFLMPRSTWSLFQRKPGTMVDWMRRTGLPMMTRAPLILRMKRKHPVIR